MEDSVNEHSRRMSEALDKIGISAREIAWRRKIWKHLTTITNLIKSLESDNPPVYITGSRAEGIGLMILGSDIDKMFRLDNIRVIQSLSDWKYSPDTLTLVTDTTGAHPGYCRLIPVHPWQPTLWDSSYPTSGMEDFNGTAVMKNDFFYYHIPFDYKHGPALTDTIQTRMGMEIYDMDNVACMSTPWPHYAEEWIVRNRPANFPSPEFVNSESRKGALVVPTGYKGSSHAHIEWRFSFSLLELEIIHIWPDNATKCYVILKLLIKQISRTFLDLSCTLSSYHLKTLVFWLVEEFGIAYWNDHCLVDCLILCISRLILWAKDGYIPHYFIKQNNLFDMVESSRHMMLIQVLNNLYLDDSAGISHQKLYHRFWTVMGGHDLPVVRIVPSHERLDIHLYFAACLTTTLRNLVENISSGGICGTIAGLHSAIRRLRVACPQDPEIIATIKYSTQYLKSMSGALILSFARQTEMSNSIAFFLFRVSVNLLRQSAHHPSEKLRLANAYFQEGKYGYAIQTLAAVSEARNSRTIKIGEAGIYRVSTEKLRHLGSLDCAFEAFSNMVSKFVFVKGEVKTTPRALQYETFKYNSLSRLSIDYSEHSGDSGASVDPDVLMYYLQYMCYIKTNKIQHAQVALDNLKWAAADKNTLKRETALNVLGHCYFVQGDLRKACSCFVKSFSEEPRQTAALVHLAITIKNTIYRGS